MQYSTDGNIQTIIEHIYEIYDPLRQELQTYGTLKAGVKITPIVNSRTGTFHVKALAEISKLVSFTVETPGRANLQTATPHGQKNHNGTSRTCPRMALPHIPNL